MAAMSTLRVTDAASLTREQAATDGKVTVIYDVYGWMVTLVTSVNSPFDGPETVTIRPDSSAEGIDVALATDGVTTEVLRAIPLADARRRLIRLKAEALQESGSQPVVQARLVTVADWAVFAETYADLVQGGHRQPLQHLARVTGVSRNTLSARVRRAREMGLITRPTSDSLGHLTKQATDLLAGG